MCLLKIYAFVCLHLRVDHSGEPQVYPTPLAVNRKLRCTFRSIRTPSEGGPFGGHPQRVIRTHGGKCRVHPYTAVLRNTNSFRRKQSPECGNWKLDLVYVHLGAIAGNSRNTPPSGHPQPDRPTNMFGGFRNRHNGQPQRTPPVKLCSGLSSCLVVSAYSQPIPPTKP